MGGMVPGDSRLRYRIAWPSGEWGSLPIEGGVEAAYRREIEASRTRRRAARSWRTSSRG